MKSGTCKLCATVRDLQDSHLIPAAVYKTLNEPAATNPNPVLIKSGTSFQTSKQSKMRLLCSACEQSLNAHGERQIIPLLAKRDLSSPLYELVAAGKPELEIDSITAYAAAQIAGFPTAALAHFAMGIFWKASIHSWHAAGGDPLIELGPYGEPLREYVHAPEKSPFPANMALIAIVLPSPKIPLLLGSPGRGLNGDGYRNFRFYVPGIQFVLSVGKTIDQEVCFVNNQLHPIWVNDIGEKVNEIPRRMYFRGKAIKDAERKIWGKPR